MSVVVILVHPTHRDAGDVAATTAQWLTAHGHQARILQLQPDETVREGETVCDVAEVNLSGTDLAVSLGGDGTFLRLVPLVLEGSVPVLGVNFGRVGYLLELQPEQLEATLEQALGGQFAIEERVVLEVSRSMAPVGAGTDPAAAADPDPGAGTSWLALNEMVLEKTVFGHTVRLAVLIDGEDFLTYSADALIVATPTGSTAYNLSAGGPVISAGLQAMVVTPVAPHLSLDRSLVLRPDQVVAVRVEPERPAALVIDGREVARLAPGSEVACRVGPKRLRMVMSRRRGFGGLVQPTPFPNRGR